jgi:hypothetical protein
MARIFHDKQQQQQLLLLLLYICALLVPSRLHDTRRELCLTAFMHTCNAYLYSEYYYFSPVGRLHEAAVLVARCCCDRH